MKILIVSQYYYPENFVITNISEKLSSFGHEVTVLTGKPNYGYGRILEGYKNIKNETINGVKVNRVNLKPRKTSRISIIYNYLSFWKNSKRWVRKTKERFDIVFSMGLSPATILSAGNLYKKKYNVPHIVYAVDLWPETVLATDAVKEKSLIYKILFKWSKSLYSNADKILIGTPSFQEYFEKELKINRDFLFVPQPSILEDSDEIKPIKLPDGFNFVYCGNIGRLQGIENIPEIMSKVENKKVNFHIIGMGPKSSLLEHNISLFPNANVKFYGPMKSHDAAGYIKSADALYISLKDSKYVGHTIPNKLMNYLAFGRPILGAIKGDSMRVLQKTGNPVCEITISDIAKAIDELSNVSSDKLSSIGEKNKELYKQEFSIDIVSKLIEKELLNHLSK